jgi:uncharacterized protein (DUF1778 family)
MQAKKSVLLKVDPEELAMIKKAAQAERRSMAQFFVISASDAAKALLSKGATA